MSSEAYELLALTARYFFTALMVLIVLRAAKGALTDSRRAAKLRRLSPMTGLSGELLVLEGDQRAKQGMRYPIIREGMIGTSRRADVRIRHSSVRRRHAYFQLTEEGLKIRSHAGARLRNARGKAIREAVLQDNDAFTVGSVRMLLVLNVPNAPVRRTKPAHEEEMPELFDVQSWTDEYTPSARRRDDISPIFRPAEKPETRPFDREELSPIFSESGWNENRMRRRTEAEFRRRDGVLHTREDERTPEPRKAPEPVQKTPEPAKKVPEPIRKAPEPAREFPESDDHEPTLADDLAHLFEAEDDWDEWCEPKEPPEGWDDTPDDYDPDSLFNTGSSRK